MESPYYEEEIIKSFVSMLANKFRNETLKEIINEKSQLAINLNVAHLSHSMWVLND